MCYGVYRDYAFFPKACPLRSGDHEGMRALATSWWDSSIGRWSLFKYLVAIK